MDRRDESDQGGGISHRGDKERQDGAEGGKAERDAKHTRINKTNRDVKPQMFTTELFDFGEGKHYSILLQVLNPKNREIWYLNFLLKKRTLFIDTGLLKRGECNDYLS